MDESKLCGAVTLRLFIAKYYHKNLPYGKKEAKARNISYTVKKKPPADEWKRRKMV